MRTRTELSKTVRELSRRFLVALLTAPIYAYRYTLSPMLPKSCRFEPSCSAYALEALSLHGPVHGSFLALKRLSRCHPIAFLGGSSGHDPVPRSVSHH
jgi:putative membrane protein insertion efficiency factor